MAALLIYSTAIEPNTLEVTRHEIAIEGLPREFEGFRIVQLSDIHLGFWCRQRDVERHVRLANAENPDVVALTGDFVSRLARDIPGLGRRLGELRARHGVYAVLGNHDYWEDEDAVTRALRENGIDVLFDESREIRIGRGRLCIVGTDDMWGGSPDFDKAFEDIEEEDACIALAHNPDAATHIIGGLADLVLSGHTHGGLIVLPRIGALLSNSHLGRRVVSGLHEVNGMQVYISRGLARGTTLIPIRFRCRPEIAVFTLRSVELSEPDRSFP